MSTEWFTLQAPMALIGYGFRMPSGVNDEAKFWEMLTQRQVARVDISKQRFDNGQVKRHQLVITSITSISISLSPYYWIESHTVEMYNISFFIIVNPTV
jgi:hypothetical protein